MIFILIGDSSIGRPFRPPLRSEEQDGGPSASGGHLGWPHSRFRKWGHPRWPPEAEGPPSCSSLLDRGRKGRPRSWLTSFPAPPSLIQDGGATSNVWRTSRRPWRRPTDVCPIHESCRPVDVWFYLDLRSIWSLASPNHSRNGWGSCPLATTGKSISLHVSTPCSHETWCWLRQAPTLLFFGLYFIFLTVLYNSLELLYSTVS